MKNGVETLAKMFKDRENATSDFVVFGKIIELPNLKIQFTSKIILTKDHIKSLIDLYKQDIDGRYVYKGREVAMIPYRGNNRYLVLGGDGEWLITQKQNLHLIFKRAILLL